jgi:hypothetical protein
VTVAQHTDGAIANIAEPAAKLASKVLVVHHEPFVFATGRSSTTFATVRLRSRRLRYSAPPARSGSVSLGIGGAALGGSYTFMRLYFFPVFVFVFENARRVLCSLIRSHASPKRNSSRHLPLFSR